MKNDDLFKNNLRLLNTKSCIHLITLALQEKYQHSSPKLVHLMFVLECHYPLNVLSLISLE